MTVAARWNVFCFCSIPPFRNFSIFKSRHRLILDAESADAMPNKHYIERRWILIIDLPTISSMLRRIRFNQHLIDMLPFSRFHGMMAIDPLENSIEIDD
jgi:uncharacterized protein YqiB (DUF1249 family)